MVTARVAASRSGRGDSAVAHRARVNRAHFHRTLQRRSRRRRESSRVGVDGGHSPASRSPASTRFDPATSTARPASAASVPRSPLVSTPSRRQMKRSTRRSRPRHHHPRPHRDLRVVAPRASASSNAATSLASSTARAHSSSDGNCSRNSLFANATRSRLARRPPVALSSPTPSPRATVVRANRPRVIFRAPRRFPSSNHRASSPPLSRVASIERARDARQNPFHPSVPSRAFDRRRSRRRVATWGGIRSSFFTPPPRARFDAHAPRGDPAHVDARATPRAEGNGRNSLGSRAREEVERERCTREIAREGDARAIERGARTRVNEP